MQDLSLASINLVCVCFQFSFRLYYLSCRCVLSFILILSLFFLLLILVFMVLYCCLVLSFCTYFKLSCIIDPQLVFILFIFVLFSIVWSLKRLWLLFFDIFLYWPTAVVLISFLTTLWVSWGSGPHYEWLQVQKVEVTK